MKKTALLLIALAVCTVASAQWSFGYKTGFNFASLSGAEDIENLETRMKTGFLGGLLTEYRISTTFGLQGELYYSRQGQSWVDKSPDQDNVTKIKQKDRINYLNLPVLLKIYPIEEIAIEVGPQIGYALNSASYTKLKIDYASDGLTKGWNKTRIGLKNNTYNAFDYGVVMGVSLKASMNSALSVRYYLGLADYSKNDNNKMQNRAIQLAVIQKF